MPIYIYLLTSKCKIKEKDQNIVKETISSKLNPIGYRFECVDSGYSLDNDISYYSLKDAKESSSTILKKFKTKGVYPSTT